jgi:hypothetical protein
VAKRINEYIGTPRWRKGNMNCDELKSSVLTWMGSNIECRSSGRDSIVAALPILKPNGDPIELGLEKVSADLWKLSDLGDTHATLFLGGVDLFDEYVRAEEFRQIVASHRISNTPEELSLLVSAPGLVEGMFEFVHAIQSVLALQLTVRTKQPSRDFASIIAKFLAEERASFDIPAEPIEGKSGRWKFNFILNGNSVREETLVKALTATSKGVAMKIVEQSAFEILDVRQKRDAGTVVITDDEGEREAYWHGPILRVLAANDIPVISYQGNRQELRALALKYAS